MLLKLLNKILNTAIVLVLLVTALYSVYCIWDNNSIYDAPAELQKELKSQRPDERSPSFDELLKVNPDVAAWVTLEGTKIDDPIVQGEDNQEYLNKNVYGEYALAGSLFLDSRCDRTFQGSYQLVYGHHMEKHRMFGDLDLYRKKKFFNKNTTGTLILPDRSYKLEIFACMQVSASEDSIFATGKWQADTSGLVDFVRKNAEHVHQQTMDNIGKSEDFSQILAMSTCSSEFTDARTVLLAVMKPYSPET